MADNFGWPNKAMAQQQGARGSLKGAPRLVGVGEGENCLMTGNAAYGDCGVRRQSSVPQSQKEERQRHGCDSSTRIINKQANRPYPDLHVGSDILKRCGDTMQHDVQCRAADGTLTGTSGQACG